MESYFSKLQILVIFLLFNTTYKGHCQEFQFNNWTLSDGLSNNEVTDITQDHQGHMWFATRHGLNKFNGYEFEIFRHNPYDTNSIRANYIEHLHVDIEGNICASLSVGGVSVYQFSKHGFINVISEELDEPLLSKNQYVTAISNDNTGRLWFGTFAGINLVNLFQKTYHLISQIKYKGQLARIKSIHPYSDNMLMLGTDIGLFLYAIDTKTHEKIKALYKNKKEPFLYPVGQIFSIGHEIWVGSPHAGLSKFDKNKKVLLPYWDDIDPTLSQAQNCLSIFTDEDSNVWASFKSKGVDKIDTFANKLTHASIPNSSSKASGINNSEGEAWIISVQQGIFSIDKNEKIISVVNKVDQKENYNYNSPFVDKDGALWLSKFGEGVCRINKMSVDMGINHVFNKNTDSAAHSRYANDVYYDNKDNLWIGTPSGVKLYDKNGQISTLLNGITELDNLFVQDIAQDNNNNYWIASNEGLFKLNTAHKKVKKYIHKPKDSRSLSSNFIRSLFIDEQGKLWVLTGNGLNLYSPISDNFKVFRKLDHDSSLSGNDVRTMVQSGDNAYWIGYVKSGISQMKYDPKMNSIECKPYMFTPDSTALRNTMTVNDLCIDNEDDVWVGTFSKGLLKWSYKKDKLIAVFPRQDPIPNIASLLIDSSDYLWISSNDGLYRYHIESENFIHITDDNNLQSKQFNIGSSSIRSDGRFCFGGVFGINHFDPNSLNISNQVPVPRIDGINRFNHSIERIKNSLELKKIKLTQKDKYISIHFSALKFDKNSKLKYSYRMDGVHDDWIYCNETRQASFSNLKGGEYLFRVRAGDSYGNWSDQEARLKIFVAPPFYLTKWFILFSLLALAGSIYILQRLIWINKLKQIKEIEKVREVAAADFHDDLGHRLTKISLYTESLMKFKDDLDPSLVAYLNKIKHSSSDLFYALKDFVWVMNPKHDTIVELVVLLRDFGTELFEDTGKIFDFELAPDLVGNLKLPMDWKRNIVLIFKEAMTNSLKHSQCTRVKFSLFIKNHRLIITLIDNGNGFLINSKHQGYGLNNMRNRANKIDATLLIFSDPAEKTEVQLVCNLKKKANEQND